MKKLLHAFTAIIICLFQVTSAATAQDTKPLSSKELAERTAHHRAVEAAIWDMPIVSVDAMRPAFFRDAKANYNDIVFWSKPSDWKNQTTTPNASSLYVYFVGSRRGEGHRVGEEAAALSAGQVREAARATVHRHGGQALRRHRSL